VLITAENFPTPYLALRTHDQDKLTKIRQFAGHQAAGALELLDFLQAAQFDKVARHQRRPILVEAFTRVCAWRYKMALRAPRPEGNNDVGVSPERFRTTIADGGANYDRLGDYGRLRHGSTWDAETRTYVGGQATAASTILTHYGELALERIRRDGTGDKLRNVVSIPGASRLLSGNQLVAGEPARAIARDLLRRMAARGLDVSTVETGGNLIYAVTADPAQAEALRNIAFIHLAGAVEFDRLRDRIEAWQLARYLLFQGPLCKMGSDAAIRVFLVAVGAMLFGRAPVMQQDADLRCMVLAQEDALIMPADGELHATTTTVNRI
jgi:hypothetical protein